MKFVRFGNPGAEKPGLIDGQGGLRVLGSQLQEVRNGTAAPVRRR
jgi:hypothetical protein